MNELKQNEMLEKITEHNQNFNFDFSEFYFEKKLWKKEYLEKYGEIPKCIQDSERKVPVHVNAETKEEFRVIPPGGRTLDLDRTKKLYKIEYSPSINCIVFESWVADKNNQTIKKMNFIYLDAEKNVYLMGNDNNYKVLPSAQAVKTVSEYCVGTCLSKNIEKMYYDAFKTLFPIAFDGGCYYNFIKNKCLLESFLKQKEVMRKNGPKQRKIDELCAIELPDAVELIKKSLTEKSIRGSYVVASRMNEDFAVLRWFKEDMRMHCVVEVARMYVSKKEIHFCRKNSFGEYVVGTSKMGAWNFCADCYIKESEDVYNGTKLEYFQSCEEELEDDSRKVKLLWLFLTYPIAEKMWKTKEYKKITERYIRGYNYELFSNYLADLFGPVDVNAKNIKKALGFNDYQLKKVMISVERSTKYWCDTSKSVTTIKHGLKTKDISYMDNETFDTLVDFMNLAYDSYYAAGRLGLTLLEHYPLKTVTRVARQFLDLGLSVASLREKHVFPYYLDYLTMSATLNDNTFKPYFKTIDEIHEMHDAAVAIYNLRINGIKKASFEKNAEKWKKLEFEKDLTYAVIAPVEPNDLAVEGLALRHCVKSYIERVTHGATNIMFIRKKEELDKPFFTVEVDNNRVIQQVHGFCNCNVDTVDGLMDFVKAWAKDKKLKINGIDKVR